MELAYSSASQEFVITLREKGKCRLPLGTDVYGNISRKSGFFVFGYDIV